jgi:glycogen debranching enzyme GlgX
MRVDVGRPEPLGLSLSSEGGNIAVYSAHAERIELCLFDAEDRETRLTLPARTGDVFHGFVPGLTGGARYGLRAHGPWAPHEGHRFNPAKLLVDPYARALDRPFTLHPTMLGQYPNGQRNDDDSGAFVPKGVALVDQPTPASQRPGVPWADTIAYELHVRGFTRSHPEIPERLRGTCAALAHPAAIAHLTALGVTAVELLPIAAAIDEPHLVRAGLSNYWGYNTIGWFAPDPRLAPGGLEELRAAVSALHDAGIEVILDVVFNHSGEGDTNGPTVSLRGLDNASYYRTIPEQGHRYVDDTGCGNTLAFDHPAVVRLAVDSLRHWALATGVDGFRFDLATTLGRRASGFDANAPLLAAIEADPLLRTLKLVAEPWDIGPGGYQAGAFPPAWGEWNDKYRDTVRRWWRGDVGLTGELATRLAGSADVLRWRQRAPSRSINFITAHDGFTLTDLVSYVHKHNEANGEGNRDGTDANYSWNHGTEGIAADARTLAARRRDVRALLATLLCSRGTPMLAMGDELGRTQRGNNNAYAQDNALAWIDWSRADGDLVSFVSGLIAVRKAHPALRADRWLTGVANPATSVSDVSWQRPDGGEMSSADWDAPEARTLVAVFAEGASFTAVDRVAVVLNSATRDVPVLLPPARRGFRWHQVLDTSSETPFADRPPLAEVPCIGAAARSVALVVERPQTAARRAEPEPAVRSNSDESATDREPSAAAAPSSRAAQPTPSNATLANASTAPMTFPRAAGILLHPTSLPGPHGIGDLGPDAHRFVEVLAAAGMTLWQMLPLGPTGYGDSPYQCFSAFAGNPLLIHVDGPGGDFPAHAVDFGPVIAHKQTLLREATTAFVPSESYQAFITQQSWWLEDYALFMALKQAHGGAPWTAWDTDLAQRDPVAMAAWGARLADEVEHVRRAQFLFFEQFHALRAACAARGIRLMGDLPIYVAHDSADVWANPGLFKLEADGRPTVQAGVPPDYFSATGQLWGNPIYNWDALQASNYEWWVRRMRAAFTMFDCVRIDHFRGFEAYWEVPGTDTTAVNGQWVPGPGAALFSAITDALGPLPIVAENLGLITPAVEELRERFGYPGMSILQFAFGGDDQANDFRPHTFPRERVVYTGTHDNDTTVGWWNSQPGGDSTRTIEEIEREKAYARRYLDTDGREIHWTLIRAALASVADTVLIPLQDVLGLGSEARMNLPGRQAGNWGFRFTWDQLTPDHAHRLRALVTLYDR